jgi:transposase
MRYELTDFEWAAIKPFLPNKPRGVPRVNDRRVLNGIFWVLRSGAPWRDLPENSGPYTTCYNRFVRWRRAGVWDQLMNALTAGHDASVQMIDTSIVRSAPIETRNPKSKGTSPRRSRSTRHHRRATGSSTQPPSLRHPVARRGLPIHNVIKPLAAVLWSGKPGV